MNWTRYKTLIFTGGLTVVVSGALIFWLLSSRGASRDLRDGIRSLESAQSRLVASDPYPSERNVEQLRAEQEKVRERRDEMMQTMREGQIDPPPMGSPSRFVDFVRNEWVPQMLRSAAEAQRGGEAGVVLRDSSFGLQKYFEGELPAAGEVSDLMVRLETLSHLGKLLFESGISELVNLRPVEPETRTDRRRAEPRRGLGAFGQSGPAATEPEEEPADGAERLKAEKERLFESVEYRLEFRVYEDFFWAAINNLLADPNQIVIKRLTVTNGNDKLWPEYLKPAITGAGRAPEARRPAPRAREMSALERELMRLEGGTPEREAAGEETARTALPGLDERRQLTTGGSLLNVVMDVVVHRLKAETPETTEGS